MTIPGKKTQKISDTPQSKDEITKAMIKMIRTLVTLSQTMKALPETRYLTMKLLYYNEVTPPDYQPKFFRETTSNEKFSFYNNFLKMKVGGVSTAYHTMDVKIRTNEMFLESDDEDALTDSEKEKEAESSLKESESDSEVEKKKKSPVTTEKEKIKDSTSSQETQIDTEEEDKLSKEVSQLSFKQKSKEEIEEEEYLKCLAFILIQEVVSEETIVQNLKIQQADASRHLERAKKEKLVNSRFAKRKNGYPVIKNKVTNSKREEVLLKISEMEKVKEKIEEIKKDEKKQEEKIVETNREGSISPVLGDRTVIPETPKKDESKSTLQVSPKDQEEVTPKSKRKVNELEDSQNDPFDFENSKISTVNNAISQKKRKMYRDVKKISM